jgi:hypothetical protein
MMVIASSQSVSNIRIVVFVAILVAFVIIIVSKHAHPGGQREHEYAILLQHDPTIARL